MMRKFMKAAENRGHLANKPAPARFEEIFYFFYGTLMDSSTLSKVLNHPGQPELHPAMLFRYHMKLWGDCPAIFVGPDSNEVIHGMAYKVRSQKEEDSLAAYETDMYRVRGCTMTFNDGSQTPGRTFVWNAEIELLREGSFDLKDWLLKKRELEILN